VARLHDQRRCRGEGAGAHRRHLQARSGPRTRQRRAPAPRWPSTGRRVDGMYPRHDLVNIWKWKRLDETATVAQPAQAPKAAQPASDAPKASPTQQPASSAPLPPSTDADGHQEQGGRLERIHKREDDAGQALSSLSGHLPAVRRGRYATRPRARTAPLRRAGGGVRVAGDARGRLQGIWLDKGRERRVLVAPRDRQERRAARDHRGRPPLH